MTVLAAAGALRNLPNISSGHPAFCRPLTGNKAVIADLRENADIPRKTVSG